MVFIFKKGKLFLVDHNPIIKKWANEFNINWKLVKYSIRFTYKHVNGIIAVSSGIKDNILKIINIPKKKINVIYNPISNNLKKFKKNNYDKQKIFGNSKFNIVSTGSLKKSKDYITLFRAIKILVKKNIDISLYIIGDGDERDNLEKYINQNALTNHIKLMGYISEPFLYLVNADLYVNSSLYDGLPLSIIEAVISRIPIVSTDCESGPREILNNGKYGTLVPIKNFKYLSIEIENILLKNKIIAKADDKEILKYDSEEISKQYLKYFF